MTTAPSPATLAPTALIDSDHPAVIEFARRATAAGARERAIQLSTERLRSILQTELWLDGGWVKATPAFNLALCERFGIHPLDWDGRNDSLYHPYDCEGRRHMEYVNQRGSFEDVPVARIAADFAALYPGWAKPPEADADFAADAAREAL